MSIYSVCAAYRPSYRKTIRRIPRFPATPARQLPTAARLTSPCPTGACQDGETSFTFASTCRLRNRGRLRNASTLRGFRPRFSTTMALTGPSSVASLIKDAVCALPHSLSPTGPPFRISPYSYTPRLPSGIRKSRQAQSRYGSPYSNTRQLSVGRPKYALRQRRSMPSARVGHQPVVSCFRLHPRRHESRQRCG